MVDREFAFDPPDAVFPLRTPPPCMHCSLDEDPYLAGLRQDSRFTEILNEVHRSLRAMYDHVVEAENNNDWQSLCAKTEII